MRGCKLSRSTTTNLKKRTIKKIVPSKCQNSIFIHSSRAIVLAYHYGQLLVIIAVYSDHVTSGLRRISQISLEQSYKYILRNRESFANIKSLTTELGGDLEKFGVSS